MATRMFNGKKFTSVTHTASKGIAEDLKKVVQDRGGQARITTKWLGAKAAYEFMGRKRPTKIYSVWERGTK